MSRHAAIVAALLALATLCSASIRLVSINPSVQSFSGSSSIVVFNGPIYGIAMKEYESSSIFSSKFDYQFTTIKFIDQQIGAGPVVAQWQPPSPAVGSNYVQTCPDNHVMVGYTSLAYENYGFTEGDRRFKISCRLFSGIESRDCVWSAPLGGGHSLQDDPNQGMVFAGLRSDRSGDRRSWRYRVCKISCDSDLSFEPTSATACRECLPGTYRPSENDKPCRICPRGNVCPTMGTVEPQMCDANIGRYQDQTGQHSCKPASKCQAGQYMHMPATFTSDTSCATCHDGKYQDDTNHLETSCKQQPSCSPGFYTSEPATSSVRRVCASCDLGIGFSTAENADLCTEVSTCNAGFRELDMPTRTSDRTCTSCVPRKTYMDETGHTFDACKTVGPVCEAGHFQTAEPTVTSDRKCAACPVGRFSPTPDSANCSPCPLGTHQPNESAISCVPCDPAAGQFSNVTAARLCASTSAPCADGKLEITATASSDRACVASFERATVAAIGHYAYTNSAGKKVGVDYLASPKASLGGAALPGTLTLPKAGGEVALVVAAADTFKVRLSLDRSVSAQLAVDVTYCGAMTGADGAVTAAALSLTPLVVEGYSLNQNIAFGAADASVEATADGLYCLSLSALSAMSSTGWTMDQLVLRVRGLPALTEESTLQLSRLSVIKVSTTYISSRAHDDPGQRLLVRDQEAPQFVLCPVPSRELQVEVGQETVTASWPVPQAVDNSGLAFVDEGLIYGFDGQEEDIAVTLSANDQQGSAELSLLRAPYRVVYTAVDSAGNSAECAFEFVLDYAASTGTVAATLGDGDIVRSVETTRAGTLLTSALVEAGLGTDQPLQQFQQALLGLTQLEIVLAASDAVGGGFRLNAVDDGVTSVAVDLVWAVEGIAPAALQALRVGVDSSMFAYVILRPRSDDEMRRRRDETVTPLADERRFRLEASVLQVGQTGISVQGSTAALPSGLSFGEIVVQLSFPQGIAGSLSSLLGFVLQPGSHLSVQRHVLRPLSEAETRLAQTYFSYDDSTPPVLAGCPGDLSVAAAAGEATALVSWPVPTATEDVGAAWVWQTSGPAPGSVLGLTRRTGAVAVSYEAANEAGLRASCSFGIRVVDTEPPTVGCPPAEANLTFPAAVGTAFAVVPEAVWSPTLVADNSGEAPSVVPPSSLELGVGTFALQTRVVDGSGNAAVCNVTVHVVDTTPPTFGSTCPEDQLVTTLSALQPFFWAAPQAQDNDRISYFERPANRSGTAFPPGAHELTYVAQDASGNEAKCRFALSVLAPASSTATKSSASTTTYSAIGGGVGGALLLLVLVLLILRRRANRKLPADFASIIETLQLDAYGTVGSDGQTHAARPREVARESVTIVKEIGKGNFGIVAKAQFAERRGRMVMPAYLVAVKQLHSTASTEARNEILAEAAVMAQFEHENVLRLVGVVTKGDPILVLIEFMEHGALQSYIKARAGKLTEQQRLGFVVDLASGLAYLHARGFIHRDVAARNVLLSSSLTAKLADFGLTRESQTDSDYYRSQGGAVPVRWTAPEALEERKFSPASDTYAFGITVYEIWTDAAMPFQGWTNQRVWVNVSTGYRLERPAGCSEALYETVLLPSWAFAAADRPRMEELAGRLRELKAISVVAPETEPEKVVDFGFGSHDEVASKSAAGPAAYAFAASDSEYAYGTEPLTFGSSNASSPAPAGFGEDVEYSVSPLPDADTLDDEPSFSHSRELSLRTPDQQQSSPLQESDAADA